jgi:hypothetical protein
VWTARYQQEANGDSSSLAPRLRQLPAFGHPRTLKYAAITIKITRKMARLP